MRKEILLANPRGFCAGVDRAIAIVKRALAQFGAPIYVRHEVVHNKFVVDELKAQGAIFIENLADVPPGAILIFSAHGVSLAVREEAKTRGFTLFDATCPLVTKVHSEVKKLSSEGYEIIMIGHKGHPEVEGTMGQADSARYLVETLADVEQLQVVHSDKLAYVTQTTLSVDDAHTIITALKTRFPAIIGPKKEDICYATQNRQDAVKKLSQAVDIVIVVGSPNSSNSNRLREVATHLGKPAYMIDNASELQKQWFDQVAKVGVTAGASAPEILVQEVLQKISQFGITTVNELTGVTENILFNLPKELMDLENIPSK
jgi:4-hydroxy-3-methylbut-2-enyl diphosphate reductase